MCKTFFHGTLYLVKIGIIRLSSLGDILHTLPLVATLKQSLPHCHITWVVEEEFAPLLTLCREVDRVVKVPLKKWGRSWLRTRTWEHFFSLKKELKNLRLEVTLDPQGLLKSGVVAQFTQAPKRIGFARDNSREGNFLFQHIKVPAKKEVNVTYKNHLLLSPLAIPWDKQLTWPTFTIPPLAKEKIRTFLAPLKLKKIVLVNPWSTVKLKELPLEQLKELCDHLYKKNGCRPLLMFGPQEEAMATSWAKVAPVHLGPKTNLIEAVALIQEGHEYIGCDSGPTYIAALLKKPTTVLFGPTNADRQALPFDNVRAVYSSYDCPTVKPSPITAPYRCAIKNCPNNLCMRQYRFDFLSSVPKNG